MESYVCVCIMEHMRVVSYGGQCEGRVGKHGIDVLHIVRKQAHIYVLGSAFHIRQQFYLNVMCVY